MNEEMIEPVVTKSNGRKASWLTVSNIFWVCVVVVLVAIGLSNQRSLYSTTAMLNGAFFGAIGGALGAILEFLIRRRWGTTAVTLGAILGFVVGHSAEQGVNFVGDRVYQSVVRPNVDRVVLERQLLTDPKMRWLKVLRENEPTTYAGYIDAIITRARSGESLEATINHVRKTFVEPLFAANAAYLPDEATNRYIRLIADQMEVFGVRNPRLCVLALRSEPLGDIRPYITESLATQEMQLLEEALVADKRQVRGRYSQADQEKLIEAIMMKLVPQHGNRIQLLDPTESVAGREQEVCMVGAAFFRQILSLPPSQSASLMRSLLETGKK